MTCCRRCRLYRPAGLLASARETSTRAACTCRRIDRPRLDWVHCSRKAHWAHASGIRNQIDLELLLRPVLVTNQIMSGRTAQTVRLGFVNKLVQRQLAPLLQVGTGLTQMRPHPLLRAEDIIVGGAIMVVAGQGDLGPL